jgi:TonB family protein
MLVCLLAVSPAKSQTTGQQTEPPASQKEGNVIKGAAIVRITPVYPPFAEAEGVSGKVVVQVMVDDQGNVTKARAIQGHELLREAAEQAARGWKFTPTTLSGKPVKVIGTVTFNFLPGCFNLSPQTSEAKSDAEAQAKGAFASGPAEPTPVAASAPVPDTEQIKRYKEEVAAKPDSEDSLFMLGKAYGLAGRFEESHQVFLQILTRNPDWLEARFNLGTTYFRLGKYEHRAGVARQDISKAGTI